MSFNNMPLFGSTSFENIRRFEDIVYSEDEDIMYSEDEDTMCSEDIPRSEGWLSMRT
jgi:hypothetical protein